MSIPKYPYGNLEDECDHKWVYIAHKWLYLSKWQYNHNPPVDKEHQLTVTWACHCGEFKQTVTKLSIAKGKFG
jgi:hypothetical protein